MRWWLTSLLGVVACASGPHELRVDLRTDLVPGAEFDTILVAFDGEPARELTPGEADYVIFGLYPGLAVAAENGFADQIDVLSPTLLDAEMFVAFSKQSPCLSLMDAIGAEIAAMKESGRIDDLIAEANAAWAAGL